MSTFYIEHANVVLEHGILWDGAVLTDGDRIRAVGPRRALAAPAGARRLDADGAYVGPGLVDLHCHGGGGHLFWQEPEAAAEHHLRRGVTTVLAAFYVTLDKPTLLTAFERVRAAMASGGAGRAIGGVYMEGPYLNPNFGASKKSGKWAGSVDPADYKEVVDRLDGLVRLWAVAPEREGVEEFMRYAKSVNPSVVFSVAHSEASPARIRALKKYGLDHLTHCMDATGRRQVWKGTRSAGPDEACFLDPDMYAELICDSGAVHVSAELQRMILRIKGVDRVILISDNSGRAAGENPPPAGLEDAEDLSFDAEGNLGGSLLSLDLACRNLMTHTSCGITQAFLLASRNPARSVGLDDRGVIEPGARADLTFVDDAFRVQNVMLAGQLPFEGGI